MRTSQVRAQQSPGRALRSLDLRGAGPGAGPGRGRLPPGPQTGSGRPFLVQHDPQARANPAPPFPAPPEAWGTFKGGCTCQFFHVFHP